MNDELWKSQYDIEINEIRVINQPRSAIFDISKNSSKIKLHLTNPKPLSSLIDSIDECWEIIIKDKNSNEDNCLGFGRYIVEIRDEDNVIESFLCDDFSIYDT